MPAEFWSDVTGLVTAFALVAAVVLPVGLAVGLVACALARKKPDPALLPWKPWRVPWGGFEIFVAFVIVQMTIPKALLLAGLPPASAGVASFPLQIAAFVLSCRTLYPRWNSGPSRTNYCKLLALSAVVWILVTPVVLVVHMAVMGVFVAMGWQPDEHPVAKQLSEGPAIEQVLFALHASVVAPVLEEVLLRGMLLPWCIGGRERHSGGPSPQPMSRSEYRPWFVMGFVFLFAAASGRTDPLLFAGTLAVGLAVIWVSVGWGKRHIRGVYATAALFAAIHSHVWPSPIPLFFLALVLGWLAVRTRGVLAPILVHALFNTVSVVLALRGGAV